jgi:hypothetical protein
MVSPRPDEIRRTLADRVARRVQGHGISRASVDGAVDKVLAALGSAQQSPAPVAATQGDSPRVLAAFSGRSAPDLASRVRAALEREGVAVGAIGSAMAGNHNVVTLSVPQTTRERLERVAGALGVSLTIVPEDAAR